MAQRRRGLPSAPVRAVIDTLGLVVNDALSMPEGIHPPEPGPPRSGVRLRPAPRRRGAEAPPLASAGTRYPWARRGRLVTQADHRVSRRGPFHDVRASGTPNRRAVPTHNAHRFSRHCSRDLVGRTRHPVRGERGPAGGWAIAVRHFLANDFTPAWVMDDDMVPEPKCLAELWDATATPHRPLCFRSQFSPAVRSAVGAHGGASSSPGRSWRRWGYLWRRCSGGQRTPNTANGGSLGRLSTSVIDEAVVHHDAIRQGGDIPPWKYYYSRAT